MLLNGRIDSQPIVKLPAAETSVPSPLRKLLNEKKWNALFPNRYIKPINGSKENMRTKKNDFYSLDAFLKAASSFPAFLSGDDEVQQKRELCAFLANMAFETGGGWQEAPGGYFQWGLYYIEEKGCEKGCPQYSDPRKLNYPPVTDQSYHGRGPLQISWNYNYGQFSEAFWGVKDSLLKHPELLTIDPVVAFASAIWFWTTPQFPKPSCHDIMYQRWVPNQRDSIGGRFPGFGAVVNVINGGIECGKPLSGPANDRFGYYTYFCQYFNVSPGENINCTTQKPFGL